jgi:serine/threonine-protein kinase
MDQIVIGSSGGIAVVPSEGGPMQWVNAKEAGQEAVINKALRVGGEVDFWPLALEDGKHVMMMKWWGGSLTNGVQAVAPIGKGDTRRSNVTGTQALGMVDDYLIYASFPDALMAVPFNMRTLRTTGTAVPVVNGAAVGRAGAFKGALSQNGSLVYVAGASGVKVIIGEAHSLGRELLSEVNGYSFPRFSPDGRHLAVTMDGQSGSDVWVFDLPNGPFRKLTSGATYNIRPEWTPDSRDVVFVSNRLGRLALYKQAADGNTPPSLVLKMDGVDVYEGVISRDGKYLFFQRDSTGTSGRTYYRAQYGDTAMHVIAAANEGQQTAARVSPDGRWIAYQSDELGAKQVYVKPFPRLDARYQVSLDGGEQPVWSPDGRRIYYLAGDRLMSATLTLDPTFSVTARDTVLSDGVQGFGDYHAQFDVAPNGKDIVYTRSAGNDKVVFVHNWSRELRERMSASKRR